VTESASALPGEGSAADAVITDVTQRLMQEFAGTVALGVIERCVAAAAEHYADARIPIYVPMLVERSARARLREIAAPSDRA